MRTNLLTLCLLCGCGVGAPNVTTGPAPKQPTYEGHSDALTSCERPLTASTAKEAFVIGADGKKKTLVSTAGWISAPQVRGNFIAVATTEQSGSSYSNRVKLFDAQGNELMSFVGSGGGYLSDLGVFASWAVEGGLQLTRADGTITIESELSAAADFGPNGLLPVWKSVTTEARSLALYDVTSRRVTPLEIPLAGWSAPIWSGDMLVYIGEVNGKLVLVRNQGVTTLTTPIMDATENPGMSVEQVAGNTAVLVTGSWVQVRTRLDLTTGVVSPMDVKVPAGAQFAGRHSASLADDGALIGAFSKDGAAGLFRSVDGQSWEALGGTVAGATFMQFAGRQGAWLVSASGGFGGASAQGMALLPAMGRTQMLPALASTPDADALSSDGRCAAVWTKTATGFDLKAIDLVKGTEAKLAEVVTGQQPSGATWLR